MWMTREAHGKFYLDKWYDLFIYNRDQIKFSQNLIIYKLSLKKNIYRGF